LILKFEERLGRDDRVPKQAAEGPSHLLEDRHLKGPGPPNFCILYCREVRFHAELRRCTRATGDHPVGLVQGTKEVFPLDVFGVLISASLRVKGSNSPSWTGNMV
jgi:hypothetical protein